MQEYWKNIPHSMFDFSGFYDRIAKELPNNCRIAEIGVADGASAIYLAEKILNIGKRIERFVMVDSLDYGGNEQLTTIMRNVQKAGLSHVIEILPLGSLDASCKFNDNYLHFAFIDASHAYEPTKADIRLWYRKVLENHTLAGHDAITAEGVKMAIEEVIPANDLKIYNTDKGYGVWAVEKKTDLKMN